MLCSFLPAFNAVMNFDGAKHDEAPGETFITSYGVTEATYDMAFHAGVKVPASINDATEADCQTVLKWYCWDAAQCDSLPLGIDLMVFNDGMLTGTAHAVMLLQRCIGVDDDGVVGPLTLAAANKKNPSVLLAGLETADVTYLSRLSKAPMFLKGWTRREVYMRTLGTAWIAAGKAG